ncbi:MAG: ABC transporter ATP-binding protein [Acidimicrobiia bacterium]
MAGGAVQLVDLHKRFGDHRAVDHINLSIKAGEFFSLLGPSGGGKTTTLRLIAGFERPDGGQVLIDGKNMADTPPHRRPVNTVFQSYALFPHLSVEENVAFGLRYQNTHKEEVSRRVEAALERVQMNGFQRRQPHHLSGGQQQRVALARSLILNPSVLLLDEPLGALDAKLRRALQVELKALQEDVGITFVYVTHDQEEALTMSDRLAVLSEGKIEQLGTPAAVYEEPASPYVADFLGLSNLMTGELVAHGGEDMMASVGSHQLSVRGNGVAPGPVKLCIRPERVLLDQPCDNLLDGTIDRIVYMGSMLHVLVSVDHLGEIQAMVPNTGQSHLTRGQNVRVGLPADSLRLLETVP